MALPSSVTGPLDLAPLLLAVSALFDMMVLLISGWHAGFAEWLDFGEFC